MDSPLVCEYKYLVIAITESSYPNDSRWINARIYATNVCYKLIEICDTRHDALEVCRNYLNSNQFSGLKCFIEEKEIIHI